MASPMPRFCIKRLKDRKGRSATCVASAAGLSENYLACGYLDKTVRFFNTDTGEESMLCRGHKRTVTCMAMSTMGPLGEDPIVASGCRDGSVYFWDPDTFEIIDKLVFEVNEVRSISIYNGNEIYLMVGSRDSRVIIWDLKNNCLLMELPGHKGCIHAVLITTFCPDPDGLDPLDFMCVASGATDRTVRLWDIQSGKKRRKLRHEHSVLALAMASKNVQPMMITSGVEKIIRLWDYDTGLQLMCLEGHLGMINALAIWEGYEMLLISASADRTVRVFDLLSGECVCTLVGHEHDVRGVAISSMEGSPVIISTSTDKSLGMWHLEDIIRTFYHTDDENLGLRNDTPAYNPPVDYTPPPEKQYSPEELAARAKRRAAREERRRMRLLTRQQRTGDTAAGAESADVAMDEDLDDDLNDDDNGESSRSHKKSSKKSKKKGKKARDDEDEFVDDDDMFNEGDFSDDEKPAPIPSKAAEIRAPAAEVAAVSVNEKPGGTGRKITLKSLVKSLAFLGLTGRGSKVKPQSEEEAAVATVNHTNAAEQTQGAGDAESAEQIAPLDEHRRSSIKDLFSMNNRRKATMVIDSFQQAAINSAMEQERRKAEAQEKLKERLNKRRGHASNLEEQGFESVKAQKLKEHKLHEEQMKHNLAIAQKRSNDMLKKRLEEAKLRKLMNPTLSDSDSDNEKKNEGARKANSDPTAFAADMPEDELYRLSDSDDD